MAPSTEFAPEEIELASLLCGKLRKVLWGTLSLGLTASLTGVPEPRRFLAGQDDLLRALLMVLHHTSARPGVSASIGTLRRSTTQLLALAEDWHHTLHALTQCRTNAPAENQRAAQQLAALYRGMLETLAEFLRGLTGEDAPTYQDGAEAQTLVAQFLAALEPSPQTV